MITATDSVIFVPNGFRGAAWMHQHLPCTMGRTIGIVGEPGTGRTEIALRLAIASVQQDRYTAFVNPCMERWVEPRDRYDASGANLRILDDLGEPKLALVAPRFGEGIVDRFCGWRHNPYSIIIDDANALRGDLDENMKFLQDANTEDDACLILVARPSDPIAAFLHDRLEVSPTTLLAVVNNRVVSEI